MSGLLLGTGSVYASDAPQRDQVRRAQNEANVHVPRFQQSYLGNLWQQIQQTRTHIQRYIRSQGRTQNQSAVEARNSRREADARRFSRPSARPSTTPSSRPSTRPATVPELDGGFTFLVFALLGSLVLIFRERTLRLKS